MPVPTTPYDSADYILNIARALGNDAIQTLAGSLLNDNQPYVPVFLNSGYRYLQRKLANAGVATFKKTIQLINVLPVGNLDPGIQTAISYTGYFDGVNNHLTPTLPADMCWPLRLKERQTATTQIFQPMFRSTDGLVSRPQSIWLRDWVWQSDQLQFNGSTQAVDLQLLYVPFLPELVLTPNPSQVLIIRCENALASYVLAMFAGARGSALQQQLLTMGDQYLKEMMASDASLKQRGNYRRQGYTRRSHAGWGFW